MDVNINAETVIVEQGLLDDLELALEDGTDAEIIEALSDSDDSAIEALVVKDNAIASQHSEVETDTDAEAPAPAPASAKPAKKPRKAKAATAAAPKVERDINALADEHFVLIKGGAAHKATVLAERPTQKKIAEKFDNLFCSIAAGRKPSVYTMQVFGMLAAAGTMTASDLIAAMKASASRSGAAYNDGTARSQVQQMMALFSNVGIATRTGNTLTLNKDSAIAEKLSALAAAA